MSAHRTEIANLNREIACVLSPRKINDYRLVDYFAGLCDDLRGHYRAAWRAGL